MEYEHRSIPPEPTSDTPELLQECFDLKDAIDGHIKNWYKHAISFHPGVNERFSNIIITECAPLDAPVEDVVIRRQFQGHLSKEEVHALRLQLEQQTLLAIPANDASLDIVAIEHFHAAESFALIKDIRDHPAANPMFAQAFDHLYRLFVRREQLESQLGKKGAFNTASEFSWILNRILDERYIS